MIQINPILSRIMSLVVQLTVQRFRQLYQLLPRKGTPADKWDTKSQCLVQRNSYGTSPSDHGSNVKGQLPAYNKMISQIIINPRHNENIATPNTDFTVDLAIVNMATGNYTNLNTTYMSAPQQLDPQGLIYGHTHITIEALFSSLMLRANNRIWEIVSIQQFHWIQQSLFFSGRSMVWLKRPFFQSPLRVACQRDFIEFVLWLRLPIIRVC